MDGAVTCLLFNVHGARLLGAMIYSCALISKSWCLDFVICSSQSNDKLYINWLQTLHFL